MQALPPLCSARSERALDETAEQLSISEAPVSQSITRAVSPEDAARERWVDVTEALAPLRCLSVVPAAYPEALDADLAVKEVLGEGGMGVVSLCHQRAMGRDVAVKTVRGPFPSHGAVRALLREARITRALVHPGIVPVFELAVLPDGRPLMVMQRVTGVLWRSLLRDPNHPAWARVRGDRLAFHLEVLRKVCDAVHFAHGQGVVHRDLKTSNVMLGEFGEVYVLDWGIACEIGDLEAGAQRIGTPSFMAPEMLSGGAEPITPRTDVYLLGGMLHEVLTGTARHVGPTLQHVLFSVLRSAPVEYSARVPTALAALCNRATHAEASERPTDARSFSAALAAFTERRASDAAA